MHDEIESDINLEDLAPYNLHMYLHRNPDGHRAAFGADQLYEKHAYSNIYRKFHLQKLKIYR